MKLTRIKQTYLTQEGVRAKFDYSEGFGTLIHKEVLGVFNNYVGNPAGFKDVHHKGYWVVKVNGKKYKLHRLIWLWHYGNAPLKIDHIDRDKDNNRIENLRTTSNSTHAHNKASINSKQGKLRGVRRAKGGGYIATICKEYTNYNLGVYTTEDEAYAAYCGAAIVLFGDEACLV